MSNGARNWREKVLKEGSSRDISCSRENNKMTMKQFAKKYEKAEKHEIYCVGVPISQKLNTGSYLTDVKEVCRMRKGLLFWTKYFL